MFHRRRRLASVCPEIAFRSFFQSTSALAPLEDSESAGFSLTHGFLGQSRSIRYVPNCEERRVRQDSWSADVPFEWQLEVRQATERLLYAALADASS